MPKLDLVAGGAPAAPAERFEVAFADEDGEQRLPLTEAWSVPFESCLPRSGAAQSRFLATADAHRGPARLRPAATRLLHLGLRVDELTRGWQPAWTPT